MSRTVKDLTQECITVYDIREDCYVVKYMCVTLWRTMYPHMVSGTEITLIEETEGLDGDVLTYVYILGKAPVLGSKTASDWTTYGEWSSIGEAEKWLDNPYPLY